MVRRMNWLDAKSCDLTFVAYNPKRQKTKAHARWSAYAQCKTVQDAVQAGATMRDLDFDFAKGYVTCEGVRPLVPSLAIKKEPGVEEPEPLAALADQSCAARGAGHREQNSLYFYRRRSSNDMSCTVLNILCQCTHAHRETHSSCEPLYPKPKTLKPKRRRCGGREGGNKEGQTKQNTLDERWVDEK